MTATYAGLILNNNINLQKRTDMPFKMEKIDILVRFISWIGYTLIFSSQIQ